ncbi:MAG: LPS-assembly protein LptD [Desulfobacteraceae bacterium]|nr:LPS-assembly protein LptD [Desulfobacteraceae bacterium]
MFCLLSQIRLPLMVAITLLCCLISARTVIAGPLTQDPKDVIWNISALKVTYDDKRELYIAQDNVVITGGLTRLEADYVEFSNKTKDAFAKGNVLLISGQDSITCDEMHINLLTEQGTIKKGTIFIQENNFYINGENIQKTGKFTYSADKGSITSCNGENPDWKITGKKIRVTIEGYGYANDTVLWARKVPVLYSPFLSFPVKAKRQTGLLAPRLTSSDRKGFEYEQPLFIAISRNMDATLYTDYMSERGTKVAGEFRYVLDNKSKGSVFLDYLDDSKIGDGTEANENYSYDSTSPRTNKDRYWFRMKHDQDLGNGFSAKLDLDIVSDADYLLEFKDGFTGYDATNQYFDSAFGRSLDEYDDTTRTNSLIVSKSWSNYSFNAQTLWYDNVVARQDDTADTTLQTLPSMELDSSRQEIGKSSLYYTMDSEFRSFYRQDTTDTLVNGQRIDLYPKFYLPTKLGKSFFFEPFIGTRGTAWHTQSFTDPHGDSDDFRTRATYDLGAQLSTSISRVFTPNNSFADKIKHTMVPKLEYSYQPNIDQDDFPQFDSIDNIAEENQVTWSLTNSFIARNPITNPDGTTSNQYKEFIWLKLYQSYNVTTERDDTQLKSWSDITLESEFNFFKYLSMTADLSWSPYTAQFTNSKVGTSISDKRGDSIGTYYLYNSDDSLETWYSKIDIKLTRYLTTYFSLESDLATNKTIESRVGITIDQDCWGMGLEYKEASADKSIAFLIILKGIGGFGTL